jgi:hypothetical protein
MANRIEAAAERLRYRAGPRRAARPAVRRALEVGILTLVLNWSTRLAAISEP